MKNTLLLLCVLFTFSASVKAQQCVIDSSILQTGALVSPAPYTSTNPVIATAPACIGEPYVQSVTFNVPDSILVPQLPFPIALTSISIPTSGGISNLPPGLSYNCSPGSCVFPANTLGCVLISGTPTPNATPGNYSLSFTITISSPSFPFPIPVQFPGTVAPGNEYIIQVREPGMCNVGVNDLSSEINSLKNQPNPFSGSTAIMIDAKTSGQFQFEVFDLLGQRVHHELISLNSGENQFNFNADNLPNGAYYYSIGNSHGRASRVMAVQH